MEGLLSQTGGRAEWKGDGNKPWCLEGKHQANNRHIATTAVVDPRAGWGWTVTFDLCKQPTLDHLSSWQVERYKEDTAHHVEREREKHSRWSELLVVCLRLSLSSCVHVYVYTFPLAAFHIRSSWQKLKCVGHALFWQCEVSLAAAGVLFSGGSSGSASHMFIHTDTSEEAHGEVKRATEKIASAVVFQAFIEDETTFAVMHHWTTHYAKEKKDLRICLWYIASRFISVCKGSLHEHLLTCLHSLIPYEPRASIMGVLSVSIKNCTHSHTHTSMVSNWLLGCSYYRWMMHLIPSSAPVCCSHRWFPSNCFLFGYFYKSLLASWVWPTHQWTTY